MPRESYQSELEDLRGDVTAMGELVLDRLDAALACFSGSEPSAARTVIEGDEEINGLYLDLEADCVGLFALQQPVAGDLRFVVASFKIITDLERVGDLAANLARYALATEQALAPAVPIEAIGRDVRDTVERSLRAYETGEADACWAIAAADDDIDALCRNAFDTVARDLVEREADGHDPWAVERLLDDVARVLLAVRDLERVGDHAVNIAARTLYAVENDQALVY